MILSDRGRCGSAIRFGIGDLAGTEGIESGGIGGGTLDREYVPLAAECELAV